MNTNRYTISADSRRWWWPSAAAGTVGITAITAIAAMAAVPAGADIPDPDPAPGTGSSGLATAYTVISHPCFMVQPRWNVGMDGPQPVCRTKVRADRDQANNRARETAPKAKATTWIVAEPVGP